MVRTAEQIRQATLPIHHTETLPGDLLFFGGTYEASGTPGPDDGLVASHVGISLGAGSFQMYDHNEKHNPPYGGAGITRIDTPYWQGALIDIRRLPLLVGPFEPLPTTPVACVEAIDVASYQPVDLSGLVAQTGAKHVTVKLYQTVENIGGRVTGSDHSRLQINSALALGCTVDGYMWGYAEREPEVGVQESVALIRGTGANPRVLWLDIEPYPGSGSLPDATWIRRALAECDRQGIRGGIYSGKYVWDLLGNPQFSDVWLWSANYSRATFDVPSYGGMRLVGHQYTSSPCDRSVFLPEVVA